MCETIPVTYVKCQFCTAKNHCAACGAELGEALAAKKGVRSAVVNIPDHTARLDHDLDGDELEDMLDAMGLLVG